jgi:uncharacterized protein YndB with AHSA1/START domain
MARIEEQVFVHASPERVFDLLAQPERGPEWTPNLERVDLLDGAEGPAVTTALVVRIGGRQVRGTGRCLDWERPRRLTLESKLELGVRSVTTFLLEPDRQGTDVRAQLEYSLPAGGLGGLLGGLVGDSLARRDLRKALANLRQIVEREAASR